MSTAKQRVLRERKRFGQHDAWERLTLAVSVARLATLATIRICRATVRILTAAVTKLALFAGKTKGRAATSCFANALSERELCESNSKPHKEAHAENYA